MIFGRISGWALVLLAMIMASAEAVMALGTGAYNGLATSDIWTLLFGHSPSFATQTDSLQTVSALGTALMAMPAWIVFGVAGFVLVHSCRKRRRRRIFRAG